MKKLLLTSAVTMLLAAFTATETPESILAKGDAITQASFKALSGELGKAMKAGGVPAALKTCNLAAMPLTDSLSKHYQVEIKRTALRTRNRANKPTCREAKQLRAYATAQAANKPLEPVAKQLANGDWLYMKPILLQPQCQICHGEMGSGLTPENHALIKKYYPKDKAIGFKTNELRGMWVVRFKAKS